MGAIYNSARHTLNVNNFVSQFNGNVILLLRFFYVSLVMLYVITFKIYDVLIFVICC